MTDAQHPRLQTEPPAPALPPAPPGWNKTTADLFDAMRRGQVKSVGWPETGWALQYERSLLPPGTRFPRQGDVFAANRQVPLTLFITWRSPATPDVKFTLPQGCKVRVVSETQEQPLTVYAVPLEYKRIEKAALGIWMRWRPGYGGYHMALDTRDLNDAFTLVSASHCT